MTAVSHGYGFTKYKGQIVRSSDDNDIYDNYSIVGGNIVPNPTAARRHYLHNAFADKLQVTEELSIQSSLKFLDGATGIDLNGAAITGAPYPSSAEELATVEYVQDYWASTYNALLAKLAVDIVCVDPLSNSYAASWLANTEDGPATFTAAASGWKTVQSMTLKVGMRLLLVGQTAAEQNGIYYVKTAGASGVFTVLERATDADSLEDLRQYSYVTVKNGDYPGRSYRLDTEIDELDVTSQTWTQMQTSGDSDVIEGNGITAVGRNVSVKLASTYPGLTFVGGGLAVQGPILLNNGFFRLDGIELRFGSSDAAIYDDGSNFIIASRNAAQNIRFSTVSGSSSEIRVSDGIAFKPLTNEIIWRDGSSVVVRRDATLKLTSNSTTYATMTLDGATYDSSTAAQQLLPVPASSTVLFNVQMVGVVASGANLGKNYVVNMSFVAKRSTTTSVIFPVDGVNQSPVQTNLEIVEKASTVAWYNPIVKPGNAATIPAEQYVQIQVASPTEGVDVKWRASVIMTVTAL